MGKKHLSRKPKTISSTIWFYEEPKGLEIIHEIHHDNKFIRTDHIHIPWKMIIASVKRYTLKEKLFKPGDKVTYMTGYNYEIGIVKSVCKDNEHVFVVYNCNEKWKDFRNYTAAKTKIADLTKGWPHPNIIMVKKEKI